MVGYLLTKFVSSALAEQVSRHRQSYSWYISQIIVRLLSSRDGGLRMEAVAC